MNLNRRQNRRGWSMHCRQIICIIYAHIFVWSVLFITLYIAVIKKDSKRSQRMIKRTSIRFKDTGGHIYRNLTIVPPWPNWILFKNNRITFEEFILPLLYDIRMEPLRDKSWEALISMCRLCGRYNDGMCFAEQYRDLLYINKSVFTRREFNDRIYKLQSNMDLFLKNSKEQ